MTTPTFGIELGSIELKNVVLFKHAKFKFNKGITYVVGRNLNRRERDASNMTGKSLLFSMIPQAALAISPLPVKGSRLTQKDGIGKDSEIKLSIKSGKSYDIVKTAKHHKLFVDGKDTDIQRKGIVSDKLNALFRGMTEEEFFTLYYINRQRPNPFQYGTAAARAQFLTHMFRLDDLDEIRRWLSREYSTLKEDAKLLDHLQTQLKSFQVDKDWKEKRVEFETLMDEQKKLLPLTSKLNKQLTAIQMQESVKPLKAKIKKLQDKVSGTESSDLREQRAKLVKQIDAAAEYAEAKKRKAKLEAQLRSNRFADVSVKKLQVLLPKVRALTHKLDAYDPVVKPDVSDRSVAAGAKLDPDTDWEKQMHDAAATSRAAHKDLREFESHFDDHDATKCPTCFTKVSKDGLKSVHKLLKEKVLDASTKLLVAQTHVKDIQAFQKYEKYKKAAEIFERADAKLKKLRRKYPIDQLEEALSIKQQLAELVVPKSSGSVEDMRDKLEKVEAALSRHRRLEDAVENYERMSSHLDESVSIDDKPEIEKRLRKLQKRASELSDKLPELRSYVDQNKRMIKERASVKEQIAGLSDGRNKTRLIEMLIDVYSKSGIKLLMLQKIAKRMEDNLNKASKLIYPETIKFTISVTSTRFDIIATRVMRDGKKNVSDIRNLSGAESGMFPLLLLLSLLPTVAMSRRIDTLILDEPEVNMDTGMRRILVTQLLPKLKRIIPKIIVISPSTDMVPATANVWTVVKNGSESKLVKGIYK